MGIGPYERIQVVYELHKRKNDFLRAAERVVVDKGILLPLSGSMRYREQQFHPTAAGHYREATVMTGVLPDRTGNDLAALEFVAEHDTRGIAREFIDLIHESDRTLGCRSFLTLVDAR